ncbi:MAG: hypothetical protein DSZ06_03135 [Sulfurospirillum sp.]|nr:MAG: hypothetical protein DSZ06_03135 [Sulfurospirillum sp.]
MMDMEDKVLLLAIFKKEKDESLNDTLFVLENAGVFTLKEGKRRLKELKKSSLIVGENLSLEGIEKAKLIEQEFKI